MTFTPEQAAAVTSRFPQTVQADGATLHDLDNGACYKPANLRDALGWIAAGEWDNEGTNPRTTRLAKWWHREGRQHGECCDE